MRSMREGLPHPPDAQKRLSSVGAVGYRAIPDASGGVFGLLAEHALRQGGLVCGAAFKEGFSSVTHRIVESLDDLPCLQNSKYLQSTISATVYRNIAYELRNTDRPVLFSGTACQIAALRAFLGKTTPTDNLLCVEIACHGVPSPKLWDAYVKELTRKNGGRALEEFSFRCKQPDWRNYSLRGRTAKSSFSTIWYADWYMAAFLNNHSLRQSCFSCPYKQRSGSDFLLGDYWGIEDAHPRVESAQGVSVVFVRTLKGAKAFIALHQQLRFGESSYEKALEKNPSIAHCPTKPERYDAFMNDLSHGLNIRAMKRKWRFAENPLARVLKKVSGLHAGSLLFKRTESLRYKG